jgi:ribosomal protein S13
VNSRHLAILGATAVAAVGGGVAVAAIGDDGKEVENAILDDAANRLDVETDDLRNALSEAQLAQIDKAVEEGKLTEEQAERIKEHMQESGRVLGFPGGPGGPGGPHGFHGPPGGPAVFEAIAEELGISEEKLHRQLMSGRKMRQIARANGKTLADVKAAAKGAIEKQLAEDVEAGRLTEEQADQIREDIPEMLRHLVRGPRFHGFRGGPPGMGGPGPMGGPPMGGPGEMDGPPPGTGFGPPPAREFSS